MIRHSLILFALGFGFCASSSADCLQGEDCSAFEIASTATKSGSDVVNNEDNESPQQAPAELSQPVEPPAESAAPAEANLSAFDDMDKVAPGDFQSCRDDFDACGRSPQCSEKYIRCNNLAQGR